MLGEEKPRVVIEGVQPEIDGGQFPIRRIAGEKVVVEADIFTDGHDGISAWLLHRKAGSQNWRVRPMRFQNNDRWSAEFDVAEVGIYHYTLEARIDHFGSWRRDIEKKLDAGQDVAVDMRIGAGFVREAADRAKGKDSKKLADWAGVLESVSDPAKQREAALADEPALLMEKYPESKPPARYPKVLQVVVDRPKAMFSAWYERFPRSCSPVPGKHGTLADCAKLLPEIARMGFDVLYLPPIHPIGKTHRKGKNNNTIAVPDDVGSPWAIGSEEGGHVAVHFELGTLKDFDRLVQTAGEYGIEIAMDLAFQCSPDHPYVKSHPDWFKWRPDGTVQYAENPPKKYEDILPLNFETEDWRALWEELKGVALFWCRRGVRIFRVDNPHTKSLPFWEWLIEQIKKEHPEMIFLAEAFTRPKIMKRLAKMGFNQSYTYFTWRNSKEELTEYLTELTRTEMREYFKPNFWPNTPDILHEQLQFGGRPAFLSRLVLAATLSSNYGIYGPAFELCLNVPRPGVEEYIDNEKYEIKTWDWDRPGNLKDFIARINQIRKTNPALQETFNLQFCPVGNDNLIAYLKKTEDNGNAILVVVNLDNNHVQSGWVQVPIQQLGINPVQPFSVHDLLSEDKFIWQGEWNYVELNPHKCPAHVFKVVSRLKRETDFDYFM